MAKIIKKNLTVRAETLIGLAAVNPGGIYDRDANKFDRGVELIFADTYGGTTKSLKINLNEAETAKLVKFIIENYK